MRLENRKLHPTPASSSVVTEARRFIRNVPYTIAIDSSAPRKADVCTDAACENAPIIPSCIAATAPNDAPPETPSVYGVARGLRKSAWKTRPASASELPARNAITLRGSRKFRKRFASAPDGLPNSSPNGSTGLPISAAAAVTKTNSPATASNVKAARRQGRDSATDASTGGSARASSSSGAATPGAGVGEAIARPKSVASAPGVIASLAGPSTTTRPPPRPITRQPSDIARARSCVTVTTVTPRRVRSLPITAENSSCPAGSRNVNGSSSSSTGASCAIAAASSARWRSPPESSSKRRSANAATPVSARAAATARWSADDAGSNRVKYG